MTDMPDIGETCEPTRARRSGGRQARVALRAAPLADDVKPVRPGLPGGQSQSFGKGLENSFHPVMIILALSFYVEVAFCIVGK